MDATALRWVLAIIGIIVIAGVYIFSVNQGRIRRRGAIKTFTQDELDSGMIEDDNLREELSGLSAMLEQEELSDDINAIKINPALDASLKKRSSSRAPIHLPVVMQMVADENLVAHILKHADDRVLTGPEILNAFQHLGLNIDDEGYARLQELPGNGFMFANMAEDGSFMDIDNPQFFTYGIVCFFDLTAFEQPRACYELMLKKVDELVRMLDLKVYDEDLQLLTLQHVTEIREKLKAVRGG